MICAACAVTEADTLVVWEAVQPYHADCTNDLSHTQNLLGLPSYQAVYLQHVSVALYVP